MADTSPTGEPVIPPNVFKWIALGVVLVLSGLGAAMAFFPDNKVLQVIFSVLSAMAAVLGITSPGLRKAAVVLLVAGSMLLLPGCSLFKPTIKRDLQACAATAVDTEVAAVLPDVVKAIQGDAANWEAQLDTLVANFGQAAICAIAAVVRNLELGSGGAGLSTEPPEKGGLPSSVLLLRGYAYLSKVK